jgi:hypothetical protein
MASVCSSESLWVRQSNFSSGKTTPQELAGEAYSIVNVYVRPGSEFEINVSSNMAKAAIQSKAPHRSIIVSVHVYLNIIMSLHPYQHGKAAIQSKAPHRSIIVSVHVYLNIIMSLHPYQHGKAAIQSKAPHRSIIVSIHVYFNIIMSIHPHGQGRHSE